MRFIAVLWVGLFSPMFANADGQQTYNNLCQTCHGAIGAGDGPGIPDEVIRPRPFAAQAYKFDTDADWQRGTDQDLANVIKFGAQAYGGSALMPPWPNLSDVEIDALIAHIRTLQ